MVVSDSGRIIVLRIKCNPINNGLVLLCESNGSYKSIKVANNFFKKKIYKDLNCQIQNYLTRKDQKLEEINVPRIIDAQ